MGALAKRLEKGPFWDRKQAKNVRLDAWFILGHFGGLKCTGALDGLGKHSLFVLAWDTRLILTGEVR